MKFNWFPRIITIKNVYVKQVIIYFSNEKKRQMKRLCDKNSKLSEGNLFFLLYKLGFFLIDCISDQTVGC